MKLLPEEKRFKDKFPLKLFSVNVYKKCTRPSGPNFWLEALRAAWVCPLCLRNSVRVTHAPHSSDKQARQMREHQTRTCSFIRWWGKDVTERQTNKTILGVKGEYMESHKRQRLSCCERKSLLFRGGLPCMSANAQTVICIYREKYIFTKNQSLFGLLSYNM